MTLRQVGTSDMMVAPLALGGNVFDWTADEAASFAILDAFVDAGRHDDRHRRRLFGVGAGAQGRRERAR